MVLRGEFTELTERGTDFVEFNRFDVATKELVWDDPAAWLERFRSTIIAWYGCGAKILSLT
jgi:hypothetical protein